MLPAFCSAAFTTVSIETEARKLKMHQDAFIDSNVPVRSRKTEEGQIAGKQRCLRIEPLSAERNNLQPAYLPMPGRSKAFPTAYLPNVPRLCLRVVWRKLTTFLRLLQKCFKLFLVTT